jgi:serine/threonine protein kinase/tetratricopeptide (TPR) repeat protein
MAPETPPNPEDLPTHEGNTPISRVKVPQPLIGDIGPYHIIEMLGEGGMGVVYLAEQTEPIRRRVAVKVIKPGMDSANVIARFETERQALALMNHPNVARVLDAGTTDAGRPYFVMEHVPGIPITDYCDRHTLSTGERLKLFLTVCDGIQHAHQKGIIHRDLKPSNVLVAVQDGEPVAKVIDFGVAKAVDQRLTERTLFTEFGQLLGTPEYMSPEQAEMTTLDIDTRSDIYSLGVLLYELLVGALPFERKYLRRAALIEIQRIIRTEDPSTPSTRLSTLDDAAGVARKRRTDRTSLQRQLKGDLDWITMKALEKDRTRRYATASQLADDIGRYLTSEPVAAGPPSASYRFGKFVRRNRGPVTASALVLVALLAGLAVSSVLYVRAERERRRADTQAHVAQRVSDFLTGLFEISDPTEAQGRDVTARELLDKGAKEINGLKDQPAVQATLMDTMGRVYHSLGLYDQSAELLEKAVAIRRRDPGPDSLDYAESVYNLSSVRWDRGDSQEAERLARESLRVREAQLGPNAIETGRSVNMVAVVLQELQRLDEAEREYKRALEIFRQAPGDNQVELSGIENDLATLYQERAEYPKALELYADAVRIRRAKLGDDNPTTVQVVVNMAGTLQLAQRYKEAEVLYREGLTKQKKAYGNEHPLVATTLGNLALVRHELGDDREGEALFREALDIQRKRYGDNSLGVAVTTSGLAKTLQAQGKLKEAEALFRQAVAVEKSVAGDKHPAVGIDMSNLGECLFVMKRYDEAEQVLLAAEHQLVESSGPHHPRTAKARRRLVALYRAMGKPDLAAKYETPG